jgi:hypothetical protein
MRNTGYTIALCAEAVQTASVAAFCDHEYCVDLQHTVADLVFTLCAFVLLCMVNTTTAIVIGDAPNDANDVPVRWLHAASRHACAATGTTIFLLLLLVYCVQQCAAFYEVLLPALCSALVVQASSQHYT